MDGWINTKQNKENYNNSDKSPHSYTKQVKKQIKFSFEFDSDDIDNNYHNNDSNNHNDNATVTRVTIIAIPTTKIARMV